VNPKTVADAHDRPDRFATTRWSVVLASAGSEGEEQKAREALNQLCESYWRPIFAFICRHGHSTADAQDLAQDFFVMVLEGNLLKLADPQRG
jgi:RNA polymerase sigma-70 factor (ECF subfamily)